MTCVGEKLEARETNWGDLHNIQGRSEGNMKTSSIFKETPPPNLF